MNKYFLIAALAVVAFAARIDADPDPVKDYPAGTTSFVLRNIKDPANLVNNGLGGKIYAANVNTFPALATQGVSTAYPVLKPGGEHLPHWHLRASELLFVIRGKIQVNFVDTKGNPFEYVLNEGDHVIIPRGVAHSVKNVGNKESENISAFNSENPGTQVLSTALLQFPASIVSPALQLNEDDVRKLNSTAYTLGKTPTVLDPSNKASKFKSGGGGGYRNGGGRK